MNLFSELRDYDLCNRILKNICLELNMKNIENKNIIILDQFIFAIDLYIPPPSLIGAYVVYIRIRSLYIPIKRFFLNISYPAKKLKRVINMFSKISYFYETPHLNHKVFLKCDDISELLENFKFQQLLPLFEAQTNSSEFEIVNCDHLVKNYGMLTAMTTGWTNSYETELSRIKAIILILREILGYFNSIGSIKKMDPGNANSYLEYFS